MGLVCGYAFYQPSFGEFADKYGITMGEFLARHTKFEEAYDSFQQVRRWKETLLSGLVGLAVSELATAGNDPTVRQFVNALKEDFIVLIIILKTSILIKYKFYSI